ncbi:hypothetical protein GCM10014719_48780 [Planomonospora parontospora subsp. antibiotica]|nr:hypothetical protein GCM10014719_48780 [Planomonospora parontospora subsp. antibiotica]GII18283.1 hypothetical protein Ppa05_50090 [Planomonospora parontospora subsp. antibiotica]
MLFSLSGDVGEPRWRRTAAAADIDARPVGRACQDLPAGIAANNADERSHIRQKWVNILNS